MSRSAARCSIDTAPVSARSARPYCVTCDTVADDRYASQLDCRPTHADTPRNPIGTSSERPIGSQGRRHGIHRSRIGLSEATDVIRAADGERSIVRAGQTGYERCPCRACSCRIDTAGKIA